MRRRPRAYRDSRGVWPPEKRALLAVDRPIAVTGESNIDPFRPGARAVANSLRLLDSYH